LKQEGIHLNSFSLYRCISFVVKVAESLATAAGAEETSTVIAKGLIVIIIKKNVSQN